MAMPRVVGGRYGLSSKEYTPAMAKAALDTFTNHAAGQLRPYGVAMVSVWPGPLVGTERVRRRTESADKITETPFLTGRAVRALATDPDVLRMSGRVFSAADLAVHYGFTDADGMVPPYPFDDDKLRAYLMRRLPARPKLRP